jgi:hypothetical protein
MRTLVRPLLAGLVGLAAVAAAGDPARPQAAPAAAPPAGTATPAPGPAQGGDIEDFVPSEKVSADDAVSFPVDI